MTDRPDPLLQRPERSHVLPLRDPLSDVLRTVRLRGAVFFMLDMSSPWASQTPDGETLAPLLVPRAQKVISYHVIAEGSCWGGLRGSEPVHFEAGDVIVFPQGDGYFMSSTRQALVAADPDQAFALMKGMIAGHLPFVIQGGGGGDEHLRIVCGFLSCDVRPFNPLLATLPRLLHIKRASRAPEDDRLDRLMDLTLAESRENAPGADSVRLRLSELMFVEVIRRYLIGQPADQAGWLAGLRDEFVGRALCLLHDRAAHGWTLDELAGDVGLSRSAFADRFTRLVGEPPIQYLAHWRMQMASRLLTDGSAKVAAIALEVGYDSEAAFSRAFKKLTGVSPAAWRREQVARDQPGR